MTAHVGRSRRLIAHEARETCTRRSFGLEGTPFGISCASIPAAETPECARLRLDHLAQEGWRGMSTSTDGTGVLGVRRRIRTRGPVTTRGRRAVRSIAHRRPAPSTRLDIPLFPTGRSVVSTSTMHFAESVLPRRLEIRTQLVSARTAPVQAGGVTAYVAKSLVFGDVPFVRRAGADRTMENGASPRVSATRHEHG